MVSDVIFDVQTQRKLSDNRRGAGSRASQASNGSNATGGGRNADTPRVNPAVVRAFAHFMHKQHNSVNSGGNGTASKNMAPMV